MISRRKIFAWLSGLISGAVAAPAVLRASTLQEALDAKIMADFPGALAARHPIDATSADFIRLQKWFRDHPELLWSSPIQNKAELVRQLAVRLAKDFSAANPRIEYAAWVDNATDNVLLKADHLDENIALACAITRKALREMDLGALATELNECWEKITDAMHRRPIPADWRYDDKARILLGM